MYFFDEYIFHREVQFLNFLDFENRSIQFWPPNKEKVFWSVIFWNNFKYFLVRKLWKIFHRKVLRIFCGKFSNRLQKFRERI